MDTAVPPTPGPDDGVTDEITGAVAGGGSTKLKPAARVLDRPSGFCTVTGCGPAPWAGVVTTIEEVVRLTTVAATPPKVTVLPAAPATKPVPARVTVVPPADVPELGVTLARTGGGAEGVTGFEGVLTGPVPTAFAAVTANV
jgi:hypothetical protein